MSELWIVCAIVFAGVVLAVHALYRIVSRAQRDRNTMRRQPRARAKALGARRSRFFVRSAGLPISIIPDWRL